MAKPKGDPLRDKPQMRPERRKALHDEKGHEVPDQTPVALPVNFKRPETLAEQVQRLVRTQVSRQAGEAGFETFEESEDFEVGDEQDPQSRYETFFDPILGRDLSLDEFKRNEAVYRERFLNERKAQYAQLEREALLDVAQIERRKERVRRKEKKVSAGADPKE